MSAARLAALHRSRVFLLSGTGAIQMVSNAGVAVIAAAMLGPDARGVMVLGATSAGILSVMSVLGTGPSLRSRLPQAADPARRRLLSAFTWVTMGSAVCAALLSSAVSVLSGKYLDHELGSGLLPLAAAAFGASQVLMLQTTEAWFADGRFRRGGLSSACIAGGGLLGLLLMSGEPASAGSLLLGQALGQLTIGVVVIQRLYRSGLFIIGRPDLRSVRGLVSHGAPALGMTLGLAIALRADRYVLGIVSGTTAVGLYSVATAVSETARIFPQAVGQLFLRDAARGAGPRRLLAASSTAAAVSAVAATAAAVAAWVLITPVFGSEFRDARDLLPPLVAAEIAFAPYAVASRGILGRGWTTTAAAIGLIASGVGVAAYVLGAEVGGAYGLAVACIIMYALLSATTASTYYMKSRVFGTEPHGQTEREGTGMHDTGERGR